MPTTNAFLLFLVLTVGLYTGRPSAAFPLEQYDNGEQARTEGGGEAGEGGREVYDISITDLEDWLADELEILNGILSEKEALQHDDQQNGDIRSSAG